jgi:hypothetical protein
MLFSPSGYYLSSLSFDNGRRIKIFRAMAVSLWPARRHCRPSVTGSSYETIVPVTVVSHWDDPFTYSLKRPVI